MGGARMPDHAQQNQPGELVPTCYRIASWSEHFENNRTRELRSMTWVPVPNRMDGDGYTQLVEHKDGPAHFGVWVVLLEVASKCDPRGTLLRCGAAGSRLAHDASSIARLTRFPPKLIEDALARLVEIGWIERVPFDAGGLGEAPQARATPPQETATLPQAGAPSRAREERNEGKGRNGKDETSQPAGEIPASLRTPRFLAALDEWLKYKRERGESYKPTGLKHLLAALEPRADAAEALEVSMAQGWQGPASPDAIERTKRQAKGAQGPAFTGMKPTPEPDTAGRRLENARIRAECLLDTGPNAVKEALPEPQPGAWKPLLARALAAATAEECDAVLAEAMRMAKPIRPTKPSLHEGRPA